MNMKKLVSLLLALLMVMGMATAWAEEVEEETSCYALTRATVVYTVTINNEVEGHLYEAYQIFTGDLFGTTLSNIVWGNGVKPSALLEALKNDKLIGEDFADISSDSEASAAKVAEVLTTEAYKAAGSAKLEKFALVVGEHLATCAADATYEENYKLSDLQAGYYLIKDSDETDPEPDAYTSYILRVTGNITVTPKSDSPEVDKEVDDATANIGDTVTFTLTATMPTTLVGYETYKLVFHDTMSAGLTYTNTVKVTIDGQEVPATGYTVSGTEVDADGKTTFTVTLTDVLVLGAKESSKVVVTYTAKVDSDAVIGGTGNTNEVYLEYSNNPNWNGEGEEPTGDTPKDEVVVFTFELDVTKVDGEDNATKLQGAEFVLYRVNAAGDNEYVIIADSKVSGWTTEKEEASKLTSDANGFFSVVGLEDGSYYLEETKAPDGYNLLTAPIKVVIAAVMDTDADGDVTTLTAVTIAVEDDEAQNGDVANGKVALTVENNAGSQLPSTGGMGTTLLYVVGGVMVLLAFVLIVSKRRAEEN